MSTIRKPLIKYIKDNIADTLDTDIDLIFDKVHKANPKKPRLVKMDRGKKIIYIDDNMGYVDQPTLNEIKDIIFDSINREESDKEKKYRIVLEIINKILIANKLKQIKTLEEFVNINREVILTEETIKVMDNNKDYIFENGFSKAKCRIFYKNIKTPHFTLLKGIIKEVGYEITSKAISRYIDKIRVLKMVYTIVNVE